jgi:hypothetical protein
LPYYLHFVESLRATGFDGDLVLAIAESRLVHSGVLEYLTQQPNLVLYHSDMDCFGEDQELRRHRDELRNREPLIYSKCVVCMKFTDGSMTPTGTITKKAQDPRQGRVVATLRYEWYWIWLQHYQPNSWIMILDARDSYFQRNPFANVARTPPSQNKDNHKSTQKQGGQLWFFGENT